MALIIHGTLTQDDVEDVNLERDAVRVEVLNRDGAAEIFFTVDGPTPTVEGENCHVLPAAIGALEVDSKSSDDTHVRLISSGTPSFSVRRVR